MADNSHIQQFEPGQVILRENAPGDSAYIILSGLVEVTKRIEGQPVVLVRLGPGSIFGEMSLLDGSPRSATATAIETTRVSVIDARRFNTIMQSIPREVRPLFSSLSERLRNTSRQVSALSLRERLLYSICRILTWLAATRGTPAGNGCVLGYRDSLLELCRVLAFSEERIEQAVRDLAESRLIRIETGERPEDSSLHVDEPEQLTAFVEFLTERLAHIPGFPPPGRKFAVLSERAREALYFLKNQCGRLPRDTAGRCHYDFDRYVKEIVNGLGWGVKDAILKLQELAASGAVRLDKMSQLTEGKAIVYDVTDLTRAQTILLLAEDFETTWRGLLRRDER